MSAPGQDHFRVSKRCSKACERCRVMKVKCSGAQPCARCARKKKKCHYAVEDKRVSVPESYLHELQNRSNHASAFTHFTDMDMSLPDDTGSGSLNEGDGGISQLATGNDGLPYQTPHESLDHRAARNSPSEDGPGNEPVGSKFRQNPLVDNDYTFARAKGKYWYMGPTSSWSFCRRTLALLGKRLPESNCAPDPWHLDGMAFKMQWKPLGREEAPDISNLPPLDYALHLFNSVKFYLGVIINLIDEPRYLKDLHEFYEDATTKASESRLWYAQYLLILAFGKAILNSSGPRKSPSGYHYAVRAMSLMPDLSGMDVDANEAIQALALASLYLQSIDMRVAAFQHIGQALRTCIIEGYHRHMPEEVVGVEFSRRCNTIFWIVYMLEREFSAQIGGPSTVRDEDITAKLPSHINEGLDAWNMSLHVQLSRLMARILNTVYGVGEEFDNSLVKNTQSILRNLAQISRNLTELLDTHFQGSINKTSRIAFRLVLSYHHCVVLTTRPLVMCAVHAHIEQTQSPNNQDTISLTPPVSSLIQSCVDSAQTILRTLRVLGDEDLLEAFLPFQLEDAFSSAFLLRLIQAISPSLVPDKCWNCNVDNVLERMIAQGSLVAPLRKLELSQLESIMTSMTPQDNQPLTPTVSNADQETRVHDEPNLVPESLVGESGWDLFVDNNTMGLSPRQLLDLAEQLDVDYLMNPVGV
ncbi:Fc.00g045950.m01.CDS01 [Cosmosporella sp. VM-42]